jgi:hypothetical protein
MRERETERERDRERERERESILCIQDPARRHTLLLACREQQKSLWNQMAACRIAKGEKGTDYSLASLAPPPSSKPPPSWRARVSEFVGAYGTMRERGYWVTRPRVHHRWGFILDDFHSIYCLYLLVVMFKKTWMSAVMALSGGLLNCMLSLAIYYADCILLVCLMPFRDYQATVVEMIASCTNLTYVTLLSLPVVWASSYAGDDICLIVAAAGTVLTAAQQALESLSMIVCMVARVRLKRPDPSHDAPFENQKVSERNV